MLRQQLIGLSLLPPSIFGVICNWTIVVLVFRFRTLHRPFAILTATLATCHGISLTVGLIYIIPMIVFDITSLKENSCFAGFIVLLTYEITSQTHVTISINRFIAVFAPLSYNTVFNPRTTKLMIPLMIIISTITTVVYVIIMDCQLEYDDDQWTFLVTDSQKCLVLGWSMLFGKNLAFSIVDIVMHIVTFLRVLSMKRSKKQSQSSKGYSLQESYFLKQTFGQTILVTIEIIAYTFPSRIETDYISFLFSTFLWCSIHAAEGIITLIYNSEIRRKLQKRKKSYRISVTKMEKPEN